LLCGRAHGIVPASAQANQQADAAPLQFRDAAEETRFHALASELRCVMCQNQSLADSNALIALSLRREVLDLMRAGQSDAQIKELPVQRYGEFVLYKPRVEGRTCCWLGRPNPAGGRGAGRGLVRRKSAQAIPRNDEPQEW
jgi:cytochrome c-type biogenesis protein CcmH